MIVVCFLAPGMNKALTNTRILDLTHMLSGPYGAMILAVFDGLVREADIVISNFSSDGPKPQRPAFDPVAQAT